jgi:hypothetical protein
MNTVPESYSFDLVSATSRSNMTGKEAILRTKSE